MKFIMLINVKMSTIVDILTFISVISTTSEFESKKSLIFQLISFHKQLEFHAYLS